MATGEAFTRNGSYTLSERSSRILGALIRQYIDRGELVSSLWLAQHGGVGLSSATVRSIMVELEQGGYICQPHTSAGRVPTDQGYRYFVDRLLRTRKNSLSSPVVEARLRQAVSVRDVISNVSHELSVASHHLAFACMPIAETDAFKHIEFVPVNDATVLVVVRTKNGNVSQKPVRLNETVDRVSLTQGANYLNEEFFGLSLWDVRAGGQRFALPLSQSPDRRLGAGSVGSVRAAAWPRVDGRDAAFDFLGLALGALRHSLVR